MKKTRELADKTVMEYNDHKKEEYDPSEQDDLLQRFLMELIKVTRDGGSKRRHGEKKPWYKDDSHRAAIFSHYCKYEKGELIDPDSNAHPLVHLAWRALAIACKETGNVPQD